MALITLEAFPAPPSSNIPDGPATLRIWYSRNFLDSDGVAVQGGPAYFIPADVVVTDGVPYVDAVQIYTTVDAQDPFAQSIQCFAQFYKGNSAKNQLFTGFGTPTGWIIYNPFPSTTTSFESLTLLNQSTYIAYPPLTYPSTQSMVGYVNSILPDLALQQDYAIIDFDSFAAAIAAMPITGGTLVVMQPTNVLADISVPAYVTLRFTRRGYLTVTTGTTCTILGPIEADPVKIFYNATAGLGTISFSGNTTQKDYWVAWFGADVAASGAATSAALNAAFVAAGTVFGSTLHLSRKQYQHTGITVDHWFQSSLVGNDSQDGYGDPGTGPQLVYVGADGGTAITLNNVFGCTFKGFQTYAAASPSANTAKWNCYLTFTGGGTPSYTSQNVFQSLMIHNAHPRSDYIGLNIDNVSGANNEFNQILDCKFFGGTQTYGARLGTAINLGHANVKGTRIERTTAIGFAKGVSSATGSFRGLMNTWTSTDIIYYGSYSDVNSAFGDDSEDCTQVLQYNAGLNSGGYFTFIGGRYDDLHGGAASIFGDRTTLPVIAWPGRLNVYGCTFAPIDPFSSRLFSSNFMSGLDVAASPSGIIDWRNSFIPNNYLTTSDFNACLLTFKTNQPSLLIGGNPVVQQSWQAMTTTALLRDLIGVQTDSNTDVGGAISAQNSITVGDQGQLEIAGLSRPAMPEVIYVGANDGAQAMILAVIARDALGNRTIPSIIRSGVTANTTLSGSNYVHVTWPKVPNRTDYLLLQFSSGTWREIATVTPSGTDVEVYDIVANPSGAFTYAIPTYNETAYLIQRGSVATTTTSTTTTYTVKPSDSILTCDATAGSYTTTLPAAAAGNKGREYTFKRTDASGNLPTISGGGTNIDGAATYTGLSAQWKYLTVKSNGTIWLIVASN